ncbi:MAG: hypothetical protein Tsb0021_09980 [Chlamydiales bacterium]
MNFAIDTTAFILILFFLLSLFFLSRYLSKQPDPTYLFPLLYDLSLTGDSFRASLRNIPKWLKNASLVFFLVAFLDPHDQIPSQEIKPAPPLPRKGIALYFVIDHSGSMAKKVIHTESNEKVSFASKLEILKNVTDSFILRRPQDLIGLVAFARTPTIISPLTLDHQTLMDLLGSIKIVPKEADGTAIGYAIFKTANVIAATRHYAQDLPSQDPLPYTIKDSAIILVTDGFQSLHPEDIQNRLRAIGIEEAARYALSVNVKLYLISLDPAIQSPSFTPQRNLLKRSAEITGGKFFFSDDAGDLERIYNEIDQMEESILPPTFKPYVPPPQRTFSYYPYLIFLGILSLFIGLILEKTVLKRIP